MRYLRSFVGAALILAIAATAGATSIQDRPEYRASTGLTLGEYYDGSQTPHYGAIGYVIADPFQLNLLYQQPYTEAQINAFNDYGYPTTLNFPDNDYYFLRINTSGGLPIGIWDYENNVQYYAPDNEEPWVKWTLSYWSHSGGYFHTVFAGDILDMADDPYLRVVPGAAYRTFLWDGLANYVEVFSGATVQCEVLGYYTYGDIEQGTQLDVKLVPEPLTMLGVFLSVSALTGYIRKRRMA